MEKSHNKKVIKDKGAHWAGYIIGMEYRELILLLSTATMKRF